MHSRECLPSSAGQQNLFPSQPQLSVNRPPTDVSHVFCQQFPLVNTVTLSRCVISTTKAFAFRRKYPQIYSHDILDALQTNNVVVQEIAMQTVANGKSYKSEQSGFLYEEEAQSG